MKKRIKKYISLMLAVCLVMMPISTGTYGMGSESVVLPEGQTVWWSETSVEMVSAGGKHTLMIREDGTLWAWGNNDNGRLGLGDTTARVIPTQVGTGLWNYVSAGGHHSLGIAQGGSLFAWGYNVRGQLGLNDANDRSIPVEVTTGLDHAGNTIDFTSASTYWTSVSAGSAHSMGIRSDGTLWAWGWNERGQLGLGTAGTTDQLIPHQVGTLTSWKAVAAGGYWVGGYLGNPAWSTGGIDEGHTLAIQTDGSLWTWGSNGQSQLGFTPGPTDNINAPTKIITGTDGTNTIDFTATGWSSIAAGCYFSMAITPDGRMFGWGGNGEGQLGIGTFSNVSIPTQSGLNIQIGSDSTTSQSGAGIVWNTVSGGYYHAMATTVDGRLFGLGGNSKGWLGLNVTGSDISIPAQSGLAVKIGTGAAQSGADKEWFSTSVGWWHSTGVMQDGSMWVWGSNDLSQLGDGTTTDSYLPEVTLRTIAISEQPVSAVTIVDTPVAAAYTMAITAYASETISVSALAYSVAELTFDWYMVDTVNGDELLFTETVATDATGAASSTFTIPSDLAIGGTYQYYVVISDPNFISPVNSTLAAYNPAAGPIPSFTTTVTVIADIAAQPLSGVTNPVAETAPSTTIDNGTGFTASLTWNGNPTEFVYSEQYTATVTLTAESGYVFNGFDSTAAIAGFTINSVIPSLWISNDGTVLVFEVQFPETAAEPTYYVTVASAGTGATGGGNYVEGATVDISAGTPPTGQQFKEWTTTSAGVTFANATGADTSFTMPANAVTVTANFEPIPPTVTDVAVTPATADVQAGTTKDFSAVVNGTNSPPQTVTWAVLGSNTSSSIDDAGLLTVGAGETVGTVLTVRATSTLSGYTGIYGEAMVTVTAEPPPPPTVTAVTVMPATATVNPGGTATFSATVSGENGPSQYVIWEVFGGISGTSITTGGALMVASGETADTLTVRATSEQDATFYGEATVTVPRVIVDAQEPNITVQPQGGTLTAGGSITLSVTATVDDGGTISYQWFSNTTNSNAGGTLISGATGAAYTPPTTEVGTIYYYVVVTNTNDAVNGTTTASVTSDAVSVIVTAAATSPSITTTSLPDGTIGTVYSQTLAASGTAPITWSIAGGNLPDGLTLNGTTGEISGTPTTAGTFNFTVQAENAQGSATAALSIVISAAATSPSITTTSLPNGTVGAAYSQTLAVSGTAPITWSIAGGNLPDGLTINGATGVISGTPTTSGTFNFTVQADNAQGSATAALSIVISAAATSPSITTTSLPDGTIGTVYSQTLAASGTAPITWSIAGGNLPDGLTLNGTTGEISGTPTTAGTFNFTVQAENAQGSATAALSIVISATATSPSITTTSLPNGTVGAAYSQTLAASGTAPITWIIAGGNLPDGLTLNGTTGAISGTPTTAGTFNFTVQADNAQGSATAALSIAISAAATSPSVTTTSLPDGTIGTAYSQTLAASGTAPITWSIAGGNLPDGLTLNGTTGAISGMPTTAGTFNFTVQAENAQGSATLPLSVVISIVSIATYDVTVVGSYAPVSGAGSYETGDTVTINAGIRSGFTFNGWTAAGVTLANANSAATTFIMPAGNVTVTANWLTAGTDTQPPTDTTPAEDTGSADSSQTGGTAPQPPSGNNQAGQAGQAAQQPSGTLQVTITAADETSLSDGTGTVNFTVPSNGYNSVIITIPTAQLINNNETLVINTVLGSVSISAETLAAMQAAFGNNPVQVSMSKGSNGVTIALIGSDGSEIAWNNPANPIIVTIPIVLAAGTSTNGYVAVKRETTGDVIMPFSMFKNGAVAFITPSTGTFDTIYNGLRFSDVVQHWASAAITFVAARGIMDGIGNGIFSPDTPMTRAMFAQALANIEGVDLAVYSSSSFTDVGTSAWYAPAVGWAASVGIIHGLGDGTFAPEAPLTREQMAVLMLNYIRYRGFVMRSEQFTPFNDETSIAPWARDSVNMLRLAGILNGRPGNRYDPQGITTRAEAAQVFANFVNAYLQ